MKKYLYLFCAIMFVGLASLASAGITLYKEEIDMENGPISNASSVNSTVFYGALACTYLTGLTSDICTFDVNDVDTINATVTSNYNDIRTLNASIQNNSADIQTINASIAAGQSKWVEAGDELTINSSFNQDMFINGTVNATVFISRDGTNNVVINSTTIASDTNSKPLIHLGLNSEATGNYAVALGLQADANGTSSVALGNLARSYATEGMALGSGSLARYRAIALGYQAAASGSYSSAMGWAASATNTYATAIGQQTIASGTNSLAMGYGSTAEGTNSVSIGTVTNSSGLNSYAFGRNVSIGGDYSYGFGVNGTSIIDNTFYLFNLDLFIDGNVNSSDWSNVTISTSQITDLASDIQELNTQISDFLLNESSIDAKLTTKFFNVTNVSAVRGTEQGILTAIQVYDGIPYNVSEVVGANGLDFRVNFTNITDFNQIILRYKSTAGESHEMQVQLFDFDANDWENYDIIGESTDYIIKTLPVFDFESHINDTNVSLRFYSPSNGNAGHKHFFDWVAISDGPATPSGTETDPFSIHTGAINDTQFYYENILNINETDYLIPLIQTYDTTLNQTTVQTFINGSDILLNTLNVTLNLTVGTVNLNPLYNVTHWCLGVGC